jgi:hypothetical protein
MHSLSRIRLAATAALLTGLLLWEVSGRSGRVMAAASGCSRQDNTKPSVTGCVTSMGNACYECEYTSGGGGYSVCYENESGETSFCTDYQDMPPFGF